MPHGDRGGQSARHLDETIPLRCGCVGQETTGAGGFAKALRTVPVVLDIAGTMKRNGQPFDPRYHEAVAHIEGEDGKVLSEVQRGYMLHDRVLRPAMVVVGKGKAEEGSGKKEDVHG